MYYLIPQFMTERHDSMNMITVDIPLEPLRQYMNVKRHEGRHISHMALIMTAYTHLVGEFPSLNRFVVNKRIYQHKDLKISLVVMRQGASANENTMAKLDFSPEDTVFDVQRKVDEFVAKNAATGEGNANSLDRVMRVFVNVGALMNLVGAILRFGDRHGLLPRRLIDVSPFHASALFTNLASIRTNHIYHHVYDFGTTSVAIAMGNFRDVAKRGPGGAIELVRCIPLGVVMDERIASGHYFALAFARLREMLAHPECLEHPADTSHPVH